MRQLKKVGDFKRRRRGRNRRVKRGGKHVDCQEVQVQVQVQVQAEVEVGCY
jgi:hypothetical protein